MSKLAVMILLCVLTIGIGSYLFVGSDSLKSHVLNGHNRLKNEVRSWDYAAN